MLAIHPLDPATADEISAATQLVKDSFKDIELHFKAGGLEEPIKADLQKFLHAEHTGEPLPLLPRKTFLMWYIKRTPRLFEAIVDVSNSKIVAQKELPRDYHGPCDRTELNEAAAIVMANPDVQKEIERLQIDDSTVVFMYMRNPKNNSPDSNHYSFPLDFMVIVDLCAMKVKRIVRLPLGSDEKVTYGSDVIHRRTNPAEAEYVHELQNKPPRTTLKPYQVLQPEGASFKPFNFCLYNPTNDVPVSSQAFNQSKSYEETLNLPVRNGSCCNEK